LAHQVQGSVHLLSITATAGPPSRPVRHTLQGQPVEPEPWCCMPCDHQRALLRTCLWWVNYIWELLHWPLTGNHRWGGVWEPW